MVVLPAVQAMGQHALVLFVPWPECVSVRIGNFSPLWHEFVQVVCDVLVQSEGWWNCMCAGVAECAQTLASTSLKPVHGGRFCCLACQNTQPLDSDLWHSMAIAVMIFVRVVVRLCSLLQP
jgi:hypothetical protein